MKQAKRTVHALANETGMDRRTIRKRLVDAGLYPPQKHPVAKVLAAIRPPGDSDKASIRERKTFEEWRKLKIRNDREEAELIPRVKVAETVRLLAAKMIALHDAKLENEYPAAVAGLDIPGARIYGKKLNDSIRAEIQSWAHLWP
jgi:hypothetical protein